VRWVGSHLLIAVVGSAVVLFAFGVTAGLTYGLSVGNVGSELMRVLAATLAYWPAIMVFVGVVTALFGLLPRWTLFGSWAALVVCVAIDLGGELQQVSSPLLDISPFTHVPKLLLAQGSVISLIGLMIVAAILLGMGLIGLQRRDMR
jgi:ABC-2 type transport system permease protein